MIAHIKGKLVEKTPTYVVIDCNGVGYKLNISLQTYTSIEDENCKLLTHLSVKEDSHTLYGFFTPSPLWFLCSSYNVLPLSSSICNFAYF